MKNHFVSMSAIAALAATPHVEILNYAVAGGGLARILASVTHTSTSKENPKEVADAIRTSLSGQMECVSGSFHEVESGRFNTTYFGLVRTVRQSIAVSESSSELAGFRSLSANMFMDDEKSMWSLHRTPTGKLLVKASGLDDEASLESFLAGAASKGTSLSSCSSFASLSSSFAQATKVQGGDYISFVGTSSTEHGFVVATDAGSDDICVITPDGTDLVINKNAVVSTHDVSDLEDPELEGQDSVNYALAASRGSIGLAELLAYYKRVFANSPAYFNMLASRIKQHAFI